MYLNYCSAKVFMAIFFIVPVCIYVLPLTWDTTNLTMTVGILQYLTHCSEWQYYSITANPVPSCNARSI